MINSGSTARLWQPMGGRVPIPWLMSAGVWGIFFAHPWGTFDLSGTEGTFLTIRGDADTGYLHRPRRYSCGVIA